MNNLKTKFTPGPWKLFRKFTPGQFGQDYIIKAEEKYPICEVALMNDANAALIAAAPELYTIAEWLNGVFIEGGCKLEPGQPMEKIVQQVLAKARGES